MDKKRLIWILALLSAFPPLSTDMYLPAIPLLQKIWNQPLSVVNLTLVGFFISYCISLLFYGPLSDRFGRRPPLLAGIGLYILASLMCAASNSVGALIFFRVLQAAGASAASVMSLAITKDVYEGYEREKILAYIGVIMALAPMLAPSLGSMVMVCLSWRWIFISQAIIGGLAWTSVFMMAEPLTHTIKTPVSRVAGIYLEVLKNKRFLGFALLMSAVVLPHFAFIGGSADIYITGFELSEQQFGYFFAANAAAIMAGSMICSRIIHRVDSKHLLTASFFGIFIGGFGMALHLLPGPWGLGVPMALASFSFGLSRPPSNNLVLEQVDQNVGAASSLLIFMYFVAGAFAMWLISLGWTDKITVIGLLGIGCGAAVLAVWLLFAKAASYQKA
jgi:DHA1 family bicyclomycin/chloramphenicol resistance-like MFS transporter